MFMVSVDKKNREKIFPFWTLFPGAFISRLKP